MKERFVRRPHVHGGVRGACLVIILTCAVPVLANLVQNGDFQLGNQDFYSDFTYSPGDLLPEYVYDIVSDPSLDHPNAESYFDHTYGTAEGLMMAVNGVEDEGVPNVVWSQTVSVVQYHDFYFTCWHSLWETGDAGLQVFINGEPLGPEFMAGGELGEWVVYQETWSSVDATEALIEIVNTTVSTTWNDFSLDDISFIQETPIQRNTWAGIKAVWE